MANIPAFIPTRTREMMIISKDLAALLVKAKSEPVMRKMLFNSRHFFLFRGKENKMNRLPITFKVEEIQSSCRITMLVDLMHENHEHNPQTSNQ